MLDINNKIIQLRKENKWSQTDLAKELNCSRAIIGNYERGENTPSIDIAIKMAKAFNVTLDFLFGEGESATYNKDVIQRIENIQALDEETRNTLFNVIDTFLRDSKARQAYK